LNRSERYRLLLFQRNWTLELIRQVNSISNKVSRAIDYWLESVLGGYITEFSIDCTQSYNTAERELFKGPWKIPKVTIYLD
jgi:hypothetical protein